MDALRETLRDATDVAAVILSRGLPSPSEVAAKVSSYEGKRVEVTWHSVAKVSNPDALMVQLGELFHVRFEMQEGSGCIWFTAVDDGHFDSVVEFTIFTQ